jgi:hypothetical protein
VSSHQKTLKKLLSRLLGQRSQPEKAACSDSYSRNSGKGKNYGEVKRSVVPRGREEEKEEGMSYLVSRWVHVIICLPTLTEWTLVGNDVGSLIETSMPS